MRRTTALWGLLLSALLLTTTLSTQAARSPQAPPTSAPQSPQPISPQRAAMLVYLPYVHSQTPEVPSLVFSTAVDTNGPVDPGSEFAYPFTTLYVTANVLDGQGLSWRTVWSRDGVVDQNLGFSGAIGSAQELVIDGICFGPVGPDGQVQCGDPIQRGTYQVDLYLGAQLFRSSIAVVR